MKRLRIYADTSVFGGCFDEEFAEESLAFFNNIKVGKFLLVVSPTTLEELEKAPDHIKRVLTELPTEKVEVIEFTAEIALLRDAYLDAGIINAKNSADAEHIAAASVADVDLVVSWNFKHIVHYEKINGYREIRIYSPREVIDNDEK